MREQGAPQPAAEEAPPSATGILALPFILRIGGLPTSSLDSFSSELCGLLPPLEGEQPDDIRRQEDRWPELEDTYAKERRRQREWMLAAAENPELLRGMALGSSSFVEGLRWLQRHPDRGGSKERRIEKTLARYLSRAILKLSPFSTLTRTALAEARAIQESLILIGHDWPRRSLVRLPRQPLEACRDLLCDHPPFRSHLKIALNSSLEPLGPGTFLLLRNGRWAPHPQERAIRYFPPAIVQVQVPVPLATWLLANLPGHPVTRPELLRDLGHELGGDFGAAVDGLFRLGFLIVETPWPADDPHLEVRMYEHIQSSADLPGLGELERVLAEIVALEAEFPASPRPEACLARCRELMAELWLLSVRLGGDDGPTEPPGDDRSALHEDVFLVQDGGSESPAVAHVAADAIRRQLYILQPLLRLASLYDRSWDFLLSLGAFCRAQWPGSEAIPFLQAMRSALPLWRQFVHCDREVARLQAPLETTFNPFSLERLTGLAEARGRCACQLPSCLEPTGDEARDGEARIAIDRLGQLLDGMPVCDEEPQTVCLFVQPVGDCWILNRAREGGRHHSRYIAAMGEPAAAAVSDRYRCRSVLEHRGQRLEILDLICSGGSAINVHRAQTARVLEIPGESSSLPAARRLTLQDIRVSLPSAEGLPFLVDREGRRILPLHAGPMRHQFLPLPVKFLQLFGPRRVDLVLPTPEPRSQDDWQLRPRLVIGDLILERCRWTAPAGELWRQTATLSPARAFVAINCWRMARGIPDRVFLPRPPGSSRIQDKPVYIDFTSPIFVELFRERLGGETAIVLEEVLPAGEEGIRDAAGERWAVELQVDSTLVL